jgi:hypothetical protein
LSDGAFASIEGAFAAGFVVDVRVTGFVGDTCAAGFFADAGTRTSADIPRTSAMIGPVAVGS